MSYIERQISKISDDGDAHYISIPARYNIFMNKFSAYTDVECILDIDSELVQYDGICIVSEDIELENDTYYKVEIIYSGNYRNSSVLNCDFWGGAPYDSPEQESQFTTCQKLDNGDYFVDCLLYSGDVSQAVEQTQIRILNYSNDISFVKELRVIQLEE